MVLMIVASDSKIIESILYQAKNDQIIPWICANYDSRSYLSNRMVYLRTQAKKRKHTSKSKT